MTITWPTALIPRRCGPELRNAARSGGVSLSGQEQRVFTGAARWEVTYSEFPVNDRTAVNAYRAMIARLRQGETVQAKIFDNWKPGNYGADTAELAVSADLRATEIQIDGSGFDLDAGQHIGIGDRLHLITEVPVETFTNVGLVLAISGSANWSDAAVWVDDPDVAVTVKITPPLRYAYPAGTLIRLSELLLLCVLKDINDGNLELEYGRFGLPSLTLVEHI